MNEYVILFTRKNNHIFFKNHISTFQQVRPITSFFINNEYQIDLIQQRQSWVSDLLSGKWNLQSTHKAITFKKYHQSRLHRSRDVNSNSLGYTLLKSHLLQCTNEENFSVYKIQKACLKGTSHCVLHECCRKKRSCPLR